MAGLARPIPHTCELIEGREYTGPYGGGTHMVYCSKRPTHGFSIFGISPLFVCAMHLARLKQLYVAFTRDIVVTKLSQ